MSIQDHPKAYIKCIDIAQDPKMNDVAQQWFILKVIGGFNEKERKNNGNRQAFTCVLT